MSRLKRTSPKEHRIEVEPSATSKGDILSACCFEEYCRGQAFDSAHLYCHRSSHRDISPLAKKRPRRPPRMTQRFELFMNGWGDGQRRFSELNDPLDQRERFADSGGACALRATTRPATPTRTSSRLSRYGMPPTGGMRHTVSTAWCMLLTESARRSAMCCFSPR